MAETLIVTIASFAAGCLNAIAGGGGLVTLPVLLALYPKAPAAVLFGTNKTCMVWGTLWAARAYLRRVSLPWKQLSLAVLAGFLGGGLGALALTFASGDWVRKILPIVLAVVFVQTLVQRKLGAIHAPPHSAAGQAARASLLASLLGFYDGFFGPGTGSFLIFLLVKWLGYDFLHAAAAAKVLNAATNLGALAILAPTGNILWKLAVPMAVANVAGSLLGTHLTLRHGAWFVRIVFLVVVACLILKTGWDAYLR
ncbi:MAG: hypothetical protein RLZZ440_3103 [Planctomycetota bacterium]|jgi:uncharacterized membrane protein YfcA